MPLLTLPVKWTATLLRTVTLVAVSLAGLLPTAGLSQTALLVVAHGANPAWNARVRETVAPVEWKEGPVATAFLMGPESTESGWKESAQALVDAGAREIVVVPLMVSSFGGHYDQVRFDAGQAPSLPPGIAQHDHVGTWKPSVPMAMTSALDAAPELGATPHDRWLTLSERDRNRPIFLVAHGPSEDAAVQTWIDNIRTAATPLTREGVAPAIGLLQDDAPPERRARAIAALRDRVLASATTAGDSVLVMSVLISSGRIDQVTIPEDLAGLPIRYMPTALTPSPQIAAWIRRVALEARDG